jgi:hypothetical protein
MTTLGGEVEDAPFPVQRGPGRVLGGDMQQDAAERLAAALDG